MSRVFWLATGGVALTGAALFASAALWADDHKITLAADDAAVVSLGAEVYGAQCASCHGANLEGQPNWRVRDADGQLPAPPHDATGHTWHHDGETLFKLTKYGTGALINDPDYASNMPIYDGVLSDDEIIAVLSYFKSTWPDDIRAHHDALEKRP